MLHAATLYLGARVRQRGQLLPVGITWSFLIVADVAVILCGAIAALQRPLPDLPVALAAFAITVSPILSFAFFNTKFGPVLLGSTWSLATALLLFAASAPVHADLAPALLALMVGTVGSLTTPIGGFLAVVAASAQLLVASALHRLDGVGVYLGLLAVGWMIGYLAYAQRVQVTARIRAQAALTERAAADERRHITMEVQDLVTHYLSVTQLRVTGARRALQQHRDVQEALGALGHAERLGRQAITELRRTVGLPDSNGGEVVYIARIPAEPGIGDIGALVEEFARDGLAVTLSVDGSSRDVSTEVGPALYRITREMLANIAKYAPQSRSTVALAISPTSAQLAINTDPADLVEATHDCEQDGLRWMRQQVDSLGGAIEYGPTDDGWSLCVEIPLRDRAPNWCPWWCAS